MNDSSFLISSLTDGLYLELTKKMELRLQSSLIYG